MLKIFSAFILLVHTESSLIINCEFKIYDWKIIGAIYQCAVFNEISISLPETYIENFTGIHQKNMSNQNVQAFTAKYKTINFIPYGLIENFPNLIAINIASCHSKEIHQKDFQNMTKLKFLKFKDNDVEIIEKDIFKFNPNLLYIKLKNNKIKEIHPRVFKHLKELQKLDINGNICCNFNEENSHIQVLMLIKNINEKYLPTNLSEIDQIDYEMNKKIEILESSINDKFSKEMNQKIDKIVSALIIQTSFVITLFIILICKLCVVTKNRNKILKPAQKITHVYTDTLRNSECSEHLYDDSTVLNLQRKSTLK